MSEDLPAVVVAEPAPHHHSRHALRLEEDLREVGHRDLERFVAGNLGLALQEALTK